MIDLEVSNFQSIRHATMAVKGFAAIVGRSNIGKSAIVRAAQIALTGATGTDFVRHGQECDRKIRGTKKCKCSSKVVIRTQAMELTWEKGDAVSRYTVRRPDVTEPEVYNNLDRGTPDFLRSSFLPVKVGDSRELIQIPDQFEPIFLLNKTGTVVADVLSDVARLDNINHAMAEANKDRKDAVAKRKVRQEDLTSLSLSLASYDGLDAIEVEVGPLIRVRKDLDTKGKQFDQTVGFLGRMVGLKAALTALDEALKPEIPDGGALEVKGSRLTQVSGFLEDLTAKVPVFRTLTTLSQVTLPDEAPLVETHTNFVRADSLSCRLILLEKVQENLAPVEQILVPDSSAVLSVLTCLETADRWWKRWSTSQAELAKVPTIEELPELEILQKKARQYERYYCMLDTAKTLSEAIKTLTAEMKTAEEDELAALSELEALGLCPTCDQPVGVNHRLHLEAV